MADSRLLHRNIDLQRRESRSAGDDRPDPIRCGAQIRHVE
jgi:hypothetical protein